MGDEIYTKTHEELTKIDRLEIEVNGAECGLEWAIRNNDMEKEKKAQCKLKTLRLKIMVEQIRVMEKLGEKLDKALKSKERDNK